MNGSDDGRTTRGEGDRVLYAILALSLILHSYHLGYPAWDYHNWRQSITLMVARDFSHHGSDLLHPQVAWVSHNRPADPSYFSAEFSIMSIITALLYKIFGENEVIARMVVVTFSLLGIWALYDLLRRHAGVVPARIAAFVYALFPYQLFFGRVFMPEIPAQALALVALDSVDRWTIRREWTTLLAAAGLTALAILQKLTVVFVALPALYLFWKVYGKHLFTRLETYSYLVISAAPSVLWYKHAIAMAHESGFAIMQPGLLGRSLDLWLQPGFLRQIGAALATETFSPFGLVLVVVSLLWPSRSRAAWIFRLWTLGAAVMLFLVPEVIPANRYYLAALLPGAAALIGLALGSLPSRLYSPVLILFAVGAVRSALPLYGDDRSPHDLGILLGNLSDKSELIITESGGSPNVLYYADRRGWMVNALYSPEMADRFAHLGARYYANVFGFVPMGEAFFQRLDSISERLTGKRAPWLIYDLKPSTGFNDPAPVRIINFGNLIEFRGISLRRLLRKPSAFEVIFDCRLLTASETDMRGFVHVVDSTGRTVYEQDQCLRSDIAPNRQKESQTISRSNVFVLPESLVAGRYQLRIGWYDPLRQVPLAIVSGAADEADRATVAEFEVYGPRVFRWFDVR